AWANPAERRATCTDADLAGVGVAQPMRGDRRLDAGTGSGTLLDAQPCPLVEPATALAAGEHWIVGTGVGRVLDVASLRSIVCACATISGNPGTAAPVPPGVPGTACAACSSTGAAAMTPPAMFNIPILLQRNRQKLSILRRPRSDGTTGKLSG